MDGIQEELQLNNSDMQHLYKTVGKIPTRILYIDQIKQVIFDRGEPSHTSGDKDDFKEKTLTVLNDPIFMDGISGRLKATNTGTLHYEFRADNGFREILEATGYYMPDLPCKLFSPQAYLEEISIDVENPEDVYVETKNDQKGRNRSLRVIVQ